jgi:hypothetical protein
MSAASSSTSSAPSPLALDNFINLMNCPIDTMPLLNAVTLVPCMHKVNELVAKRIYDGMNVQNSVIKPNPCPICNVRVTAYYADHLVRSLAHALLGPKNQEILPEASRTIQAEQKDIANVPFPGIGAKFVATSTWETLIVGMPLERQLCFVSKTPNSLFTEMQVLGYKNKKLVISVEAGSEHRNTVGNYLETLEITVENYEKTLGRFRINIHSDLKTLFRVLAENNEIPVEHFQLIRTLVEQGHW